MERSVTAGSLGSVHHEGKRDSLSSVHLSLRKKKNRLCAWAADQRAGEGTRGYKWSLDSVPTSSTYLLEPGWRTQKISEFNLNRSYTRAWTAYLVFFDTKIFLPDCGGSSVTLWLLPEVLPGTSVLTGDTTDDCVS